MKEIINIYINDIKVATKRLAASVILGGLLIIPGIYAWLNIGSNWDPYGNTKALPIAVVNKDNGTTILGEDINVGNSLVEELQNNKDMGWRFESKEKEMKVKEELEKSMALYGEIVLPEDFSKNFTTVFESKNLQKPHIVFYVNNKRNPIAPLIVDKAEKAVENALNQKFVKTIVFKILNKAGDLNLITKSAKTTDDLIDKLNDVRDNISSLKSIFKTLNLAADSTSSSLDAFRDLLPTIYSITGTTEQGINDLKNSLKSFKSLTDNIQDIVTSVENEGKEILNLVESFDTSPQKENIDIVSSKMDDISLKLTEKANRIETIKQMLSRISKDFEYIKLDGIQEKLTKIETDINNAKKIIENNKQTKNDIKEVKDKIKDIHDEDVSVNIMYKDMIQSNLDSAYNNASKSMDGVTELMSGINKAMSKTDKALEKLINALDNSKDLNDNMDELFSKLQDEIDKIIDFIDKEKERELYEKLVNLLGNEPEEVADFISNPVQTDKRQLYYIPEYGSRMAPFYTILACWVGCTLLISIIKCDIEKTPENAHLRNFEKFLGRFMLFGTMAMLQGLIIGIGDIILRVQVKNYPLFLLTIMTASIVFMLFIYSMTVSFGKVGEALSIVIMVLQVAGSGGTFPIELLPRAYQVIQPIMPFYPAMNALRETIGGFYQNDYLYYMAMLLAHTIIPLLLGLLFRTPLIHLKEKVEKELEKTNILI